MRGGFQSHQKVRYGTDLLVDADDRQIRQPLFPPWKYKPGVTSSAVLSGDVMPVPEGTGLFPADQEMDAGKGEPGGETKENTSPEIVRRHSQGGLFSEFCAPGAISWQRLLNPGGQVIFFLIVYFCGVIYFFMVLKSKVPLVILVVASLVFHSCREEDFTPEETGTLTDAEGNTYRTVLIGNQWWMAENLRTASYRDGESIPLVTDDVAWGTLKSPACCWYGNETENKEILGGLYNWYAVVTGRLCPEGWHVPGDGEWEELNGYLEKGYMAGRRMVETGTFLWKHVAFSATNESGFSGVPGGWRGSWSYNALGTKGFWWSSTEYLTSKAWYRYLDGNPAFFGRGFTGDLFNGYSIRCVRD